jgi:hypothetical protein
MNIHAKINEKEAQADEIVNVYNSRHSFATPRDLYNDANANFVLANEYMDFQEFLENELGREELKELQGKFFKQEAIAADRAYKKFSKNPKKKIK